MAGNREIVQNQLDVIKENRVILMGDFFILKNINVC